MWTSLKAKLKKQEKILVDHDLNFWSGHINQSYKTIVAKPGYHWYNIKTKEHFDRFYDLKVKLFDNNNNFLPEPEYERESDFEQVSDFNLTVEANLKKLEKDLLESKFFSEKILKNHDVIAIFIGGSNAYDLAIPESDLDLIVFCQDQDLLYEETEFLLYKGKKIHWFYDNPMKAAEVCANLYSSTIFPKDQEFHYLASSFFGLAILNPNKILWLNPKYLDYYNKIIPDLYRAKLVGAEYFLKLTEDLFKDVINYLLTKDEANLNYLSDDSKFLKFLYRFYVCYCVYFTQELDRDLIKSIRDLRSKAELPEAITVIIGQMNMRISQHFYQKV